MFVVSIGHPEHGPEVAVKRFTDHNEALKFGTELDRLIGVPEDGELNDEGVCALIDEEP